MELWADFHQRIQSVLVCICARMDPVNMSTSVVLALSTTYSTPPILCLMQQLESITALESDPEVLRKNGKPDLGQTYSVVDHNYTYALYNGLI